MRIPDRYRVIEEIGRGNMAKVSRAIDNRLHREIALKTIRTDLDVDPGLKDRFSREAQAYARLRHPNVVTIYDVDENDGFPFIVMELLTGANLGQIIAERKLMPLEIKIELMAQVCDGLHHVHQHYIVHRDIKPTNIFIDEDNRAKILDFGVARELTSTLPNLTIDGRTPGTLNYMAPEQFDRKVGDPPDPKSDLFSAAIVFFEFLTYIHPFHGSFVPDRILNDEPDALRAIDPSLPHSLERVIAVGLERNLNLRYKNGEEFAGKLRAVGEEIRRKRSIEEAEQQSHSQVRAAAASQAAPLTVTLFNTESDDKQPDQIASPVISESISTVQGNPVSSVLSSPPLDATDLFELQPPLPPSAERSGHLAEPIQDDIHPKVQEVARNAQQLEKPVISCRGCGFPNPGVNEFCSECGTHLRSSNQKALAVLSRKQMIIGGAALIAAVLLAIVFSGPEKREPSVGTAQVSSGKVRLYPEPNAKGKPIVELTRGNVLHILQMPSSTPPVWLKVQYVTSTKTYRPGFVRTGELENWSSDQPKYAFILLRTFGPKGESNEASKNKQIEILSAFVSRFPRTPEAAKANLLIANLYIALAQLAKDASASERLQLYVKSAQDRLKLVGPNAELAEEIRNTQQDLAVLLAHPQDVVAKPIEEVSVAETPITPKQPKTYTPDERIRLVRQLLRNGNYDRALQHLSYVTDHPEAVPLREQALRQKQTAEDLAK